MALSEIAQPVYEAFALVAREPQRIPSLINSTFVAQREDGTRLVVQRLHPVFAPEVNLDLEAVTQHLLRAGFETPTLVRTRSGEPWVRDDAGAVWRALSFIDGVVHQQIQVPAQAHAAGHLLGRFHRALADCRHEFLHVRAGAHDTRAHLTRLSGVLQRARQVGDPELVELATRILDQGERVRLDFEGLPRRICHGDLKISNVMFWQPPSSEARCLIDLDTLGHQYMAYELGDALRSWCNRGGENQTAVAVEDTLFESALTGYARGVAGLLTSEEVPSIVQGLQTISLELAARFAIDALEDRYFGWDPARFGSRREHNLVRARGQLQLSLSACAQGEALQGIASRSLA